MRLRLTLRSATNGRWSVDRHYEEQIQGFIYRHLDSQLGTKLHDQGFTDPISKRRLKLFTFSRLQGRWRRQAGCLVFTGSAQLVIASPMDGFLESLVSHLMRDRRLRLGSELVELESVEVDRTTLPQPPVLVKALSPITIYSTLSTAEGRRKTYYYSPWEQEFERLLLQNLQRKVRVWYGRDVPLEGRIRPFRASSRDGHVVKYKGTVIKGWTGIYELDLPPLLLEMAYHAGLGAKNSQGFGCIELWEPKKDLRNGARSYLGRSRA